MTQLLSLRTGMALVLLLVPTTGHGMHDSYSYRDYGDDRNQMDYRDYGNYRNYVDYNDYSRNGYRYYGTYDGVLMDEQEELSSIRDALCWPRTTRECEEYLEMERDYLDRIQDYVDEGYFTRSDERRTLEDFLDELEDEGLFEYVYVEEGETFSISVYGGNKNDEYWSASYDDDYLILERTTGGYSWWRDISPSNQVFTFRARREGSTTVSFRSVRASGKRSRTPLSRVYLVRIED